MSQYKFSISFENYEVDDYVSEKVSAHLSSSFFL